MVRQLIGAISLLSLVSCCPPEGVDQSRISNEFVVAIDYFQQGQPLDIKNIPADEIRLQLIDKKRMMEHRQDPFFDGEHGNRAIFGFSSDWKTDDIMAINAQVGRLMIREASFAGLNKTEYQRPPVDLSNPQLMEKFKIKEKDPLTSLIKTQLLCALSALKSAILPSAQAMSCKRKKGSMESYLPGILINIDLNQVQTVDIGTSLE
jgi:hypothetical protein